MTAGVKSGKAQNERMFFRFAPEIVHPICASTSTNYLSIGFAKRALVGAQQGAMLGADHISSGADQSGIPTPARCQTNVRSSGGLTEFLAARF